MKNTAEMRATLRILIKNGLTTYDEWVEELKNADDLERALPTITADISDDFQERLADLEIRRQEMLEAYLERGEVPRG